MDHIQTYLNVLNLTQSNKHHVSFERNKELLLQREIHFQMYSSELWKSMMTFLNSSYKSKQGKKQKPMELTTELINEF